MPFVSFGLLAWNIRLDGRISHPSAPLFQRHFLFMLQSPRIHVHKNVSFADVPASSQPHTERYTPKINLTSSDLAVLSHDSPPRIEMTASDRSKSSPTWTTTHGSPVFPHEKMNITSTSKSSKATRTYEYEPVSPSVFHRWTDPFCCLIQWERAWASLPASPAPQTIFRDVQQTPREEDRKRDQTRDQDSHRLPVRVEPPLVVKPLWIKDLRRYLQSLQEESEGLYVSTRRDAHRLETVQWICLPLSSLSPSLRVELDHPGRSLWDKVSLLLTHGSLLVSGHLVQDLLIRDQEYMEYTKEVPPFTQNLIETVYELCAVLSRIQPLSRYSELIMHHQMFDNGRLHVSVGMRQPQPYWTSSWTRYVAGSHQTFRVESRPAPYKDLQALRTQTFQLRDYGSLWNTSSPTTVKWAPLFKHHPWPNISFSSTQ